jgi:hypothetical protein
MPSKIVCSDPSVSRPRPLARQTIMQKLELCPKIKLNKSLLSSLHFSPPRSVPSSSCLSSPLFFSLSSQSEKKNIFTIFHIDGIARCCVFLFLLFRGTFLPLFGSMTLVMMTTLRGLCTSIGLSDCSESYVDIFHTR